MAKVTWEAADLFEELARPRFTGSELLGVQAEDVVGQREMTAAYLRAHADTAWSRQAPWHLTASVIVLSSTSLVAAPGSRPEQSATLASGGQSGAGQVLLGRHPQWGWKQFGGHIELGDLDLVSAARRELAEEAGPGVMELAQWWRPVLATPFFPNACGPQHTGGAAHLDVCFRAVVPDGQLPAVGYGPEGMELAWWSVPDAMAVLDAGAANMLAAALHQP